MQRIRSCVCDAGALTAAPAAEPPAGGLYVEATTKWAIPQSTSTEKWAIPQFNLWVAFFCRVCVLLAIPLAIWGIAHYVGVMRTRDKLIADIEAFLKRYKMRPTVFGTLAVNDAKLMSELRAGADLTTKRMDKIRDFMCAYKDKAAAEKLGHPNQRAVARSVAA